LCGRFHSDDGEWENISGGLGDEIFLTTILLLDSLFIYLFTNIIYTRAVLKVRGLTLLLRVGTLWRCGDGLFFEVPPLASDALLTTLHPLLENMLQTVDHFEISCLGSPFSRMENPSNHMGRDVN
jgi:hypothetical protein